MLGEAQLNLNKEKKMHSDDRFWLYFWGIAFTFLLALFALLFNVMNTRTQAVSYLIKNGTNPIEAKYAVRNTTMNEDTILLINKILKENKK